MRTIFKGIISIKGQFHIGSGVAGAESDSPFLTDATGNPIVPGTSWAGTFRSFLEARGIEEQLLLDLFGGPAKGDKGHISLFRVFTSRANLSKALKNKREGVGIDRSFGSAKHNILYDWEALSPGVVFPFYAYFDDNGLDEDSAKACLRLLAIIFEAIRNGFLYMGAKTTIGHGRLDIGSMEIYETDFQKPDELLQFLTRSCHDWTPGSGAKTVDDFIKKHLKQSIPGNITFEMAVKRNRLLRIGYFLEVKDFLLIKKGGKEGFDSDLTRERIGIKAGKEALLKPIDAVFQTFNDNGDMDVNGFKKRIFFSGSTVKGTLRARAEKILRTIKHGLACDPFSDESCGNKQDGLCRACELFGCTRRQGRLIACDLEPDGISLKMMDHVAIDRFTGGASDQKKYDAWVVAGGRFKGVIELSGFDAWMTGLLALIFKDLYFEDIPFGYASRRGYGLVQGIIEDITLWADQRDPFWLGIANFFSGTTENSPWPGMRKGCLRLQSEKNSDGTWKYNSYPESAIILLDQMISAIFDDSLSEGEGHDETLA